MKASVSYQYETYAATLYMYATKTGELLRMKEGEIFFSSFIIL